jgi:hypothetical protein
LIDLPPKITAQWLNSLSEQERVSVLRSGWAEKMDQWALSHVSYVLWNRRTLLGILDTHSASAFFLDFGENVYVVTAAHVYDGYLKDKAKPGKFGSQIGDVPFDLEERFVSRGPKPDIDVATFRITRNEIKETGKQVVLASPWPPPTPVVGQASFIVGFPGSDRRWIDRRSIEFGTFSVCSPITKIESDRIISAFEREYWVASRGNEKAERKELGGLSGGPLLYPLERDGAWFLMLAGVISQAVFNEAIYATPSSVIRPDGTVGEPASKV